MKKITFAVVLSTIALSLSVGAVLHANKSVVAEAATPIATYYYDVNGSNTSLLNSVNAVIADETVLHNVGYGGLKSAYETTDVRSDGYLYDVYSDNTHYVPGSNYAGSYSAVGDGYNREHTIPQSWWGGGTSDQGSDLFIVLPSDAKANGARSNNPYGETDSTDMYRLSGDPIGNKLGTSNNSNWVSGTVFEPFADRKGDLARTYFYAVAMYWKNGSGNGEVTKWTSGEGGSVFSSSGKNGFVQKYLNMLLKWHKDDPVSQWEINRNNNVENVQKNRNPFIDHPSWVDLIWGGTYAGTNAEDTSAGTVTHGQLTPTTGITNISKTSASLVKGTSTTISATSSNGGNISWSSSNTSVATVSSGTASSGSNITINAVGTGSSTITASITISGTTYSKSCSVAVKTLSSISVSGQKTSFIQNQSFSFGGTVTAHYSDSSTEDVTSSATFSGYNMSTLGNQTVTVSYSVGGTTKTTTYQINVQTSTVTSITATVSKTFYVGETISKSDITVKDNLDNTITDYTFSNYQYKYSDAASGGSLTNKAFTITYGNLSTTLTTQVQRKARVTPSSSVVTDTITAADLTATGTSYTEFSGVTLSSGAVYAGKTAKNGSNIQMNSSSPQGIVSTTSGGSIQSVKITIGNGNKNVSVYGKNTAYSSGSDLYSSSSQGTLVGTTSSTGTITFTTNYQYVGIRAANGAVYLSSVEINYSAGAQDTAVNLANYIMFEDENNQCNTKFGVAKGYFEGLTKAERSAFMTGTSYVVSTARERLLAWAEHLGKTITQSGDDYVINNARLNFLAFNNQTDSTIIIVVALSISMLSFAGFMLLRRKKHE